MVVKTIVMSEVCGGPVVAMMMVMIMYINDAWWS